MKTGNKLPINISDLLRQRTVEGDRFAQHAQVSDLSKPLMLEYLTEVGSALAADAPQMTVEELGRQMNVVDGPIEAPRPKNVGLLFFNESPERFFPTRRLM